MKTPPSQVDKVAPINAAADADTDDLAALHLQMIHKGLIHPAMAFDQRVWALCARVPRGKVATYGQIAHKLGTRAYRAVGNALNRNPYAPQVPCHRVVGSNGSLTGFAHGVEAKQQMLQDEGVTITHRRRVDLKQHLCKL